MAVTEESLPERVFKDAPDPAFRVRVVSEYARVRHWLPDPVKLDDARILDFGCGQGFAAASFALRHPGAEVIGVDVVPVDEELLEERLRSQLGTGLPENIKFLSAGIDSRSALGSFDLVYSWSVFEHISVSRVNDTFGRIKDSLRKGGYFFLQIDPLYFSPRGSHLYAYFDSPWHHLTLSLDELRERVFASPGGEERHRREWQQFLELNRLTATDFLGRAKANGLKLLRRQLRQTDSELPPRLSRSYDRDALTTEELVALFQ